MGNLISEVIENYNRYLSNLPNGCESLVALLSEEKYNEALKEIVFFSEGISWLINVKIKLEEHNILVDFDENKIIGYLEEINEGLENKDYLLVADLFEYEIVPFLIECPKIKN